VGEVSYKGHRYPAEIIAHCVGLYHRLPPSFRDVEELMLVRGVIVTYETIRQWCAKFGPVYAAGLRRRQAGRLTRQRLCPDEAARTRIHDDLTTLCQRRGYRDAKRRSAKRPVCTNPPRCKRCGPKSTARP
jgi:hypothetical protein